MNKSFFIKFSAVFFTLIFFTFLLNFKYQLLNIKDNFWQTAYYLILFIFISGFFSRGKTAYKFKSFFVWILIFLLFITGYSYRIELGSVKDRILSQIIPGRGEKQSLYSAVFRQSNDGHFYISALVNGKPVLFLADTGASEIVITPADAVRLGFNLEKLKYDRVFSTANGVVKGSRIKLDEMEIAGFKLKNISASVNGAEMSTSLLGMSFFRRLQKFEFKNQNLTIHWN